MQTTWTKGKDLSAKTELVGRICVRRRECDTTRISAGAPQLQNSRTKAGATQVLSWWGRAACVAMDRQNESTVAIHQQTRTHLSSSMLDGLPAPLKSRLGRLQHECPSTQRDVSNVDVLHAREEYSPSSRRHRAATPNNDEPYGRSTTVRSTTLAGQHNTR